MSYFDTLLKPCLIDRIKVKSDVFNGGIFNGLEYQVVTNPVTGRQWLDRNLGATRVATAVNDADAYGHLFQWGRLADGHEFRTSGTRNEQSTTDVPGHSDFIIEFTDWRNPSNDNLWQGVDAINSVAPNGWRLPTEAEWIEESGTWGSDNAAGAFGSALKLTSTGLRLNSTGIFRFTGAAGYYWSSISNMGSARATVFNNTIYLNRDESKAVGHSVRLIKDI